MEGIKQDEGEKVLEKSDSQLARELAMELNELDQLDANYVDSVKRKPEIGGEGDHATMRKLEQAISFSNGEFRKGEKVRTKIIGKKGDVWIEAEIFDYNDVNLYKNIDWKSLSSILHFRCRF